MPTVGKGITQVTGAALLNRPPLHISPALYSRSGRQIDCIQPWWTKFQNLDVHVRIEVDFDPELDEHFGITTAKQQIVVSEDFQTLLMGSGKNQAGLKDLVEDIRAQRNDAIKQLDARREKGTSGSGLRPSEEAMAATAKYKEKAVEPTLEEKKRDAQRVEEAVRQRAQTTGETEAKARETVEAHITQQGWKVDFEAVPEGPFYRPFRLGEQRRLIINTDHPFYSRVHQFASSAATAIETLLFVLAERELDAVPEFKEFYAVERQRWSERLRHCLNHIKDGATLEDAKNAAAEELHSQVA